MAEAAAQPRILLTLEDRARRYIAKMDPAISGNGGHNATFKVAIALVRGFGLDQNVALRILSLDYNPRCSPSWSERDLRHKVNEASKLCDPPLGYLIDKKPELGPPIRSTPQTTEEYRAYLARPIEPRTVAGLMINPEKIRIDNFEPVSIESEVIQRFQPIPENVLQYLEEDRGLTPAAIAEWQLGWHRDRITIPIWEMNTNALVGISGRAYGEGVAPKYLHGAGFRGSFYLYGEHRIKGFDLPGVLVEGFFDVIGLWQRGYYAVAMFGSHLSAFQAYKLKELFGSLTILPDGDKAGHEAASKAERIAGTLLPTKVARDVPDGIDPDQLSDSQLLDLLGPKHFNPQ